MTASLTPEEKEALDAAMRDPATGEWKVERRAECETIWIAARAYFRAEADEERRRLNAFFQAELDSRDTSNAEEAES